MKGPMTGLGSDLIAGPMDGCTDGCAETLLRTGEVVVFGEVSEASA